MGPAPKGMVKPHYHHIVREKKAPKKAGKLKIKSTLPTRKKILAKHKIGLNNDPRNFTWAQNGGGNHSIASAKKKSMKYYRKRTSAGWPVSKTH
ncbi:hypothetical protein ACFS4T_00055 [Pseudomonas lini]